MGFYWSYTLLLYSSSYVPLAVTITNTAVHPMKYSESDVMV